MKFSCLRYRTTASLTALVALVALAGAAPAQAHDALASSTPADGQTITTNPGQVSIVLTKAPSTGVPGSNIINVTAPDGHVISDRDITVEGATLSVAADIDHEGQHTVQWRAVSPDGHPIEGTFSFNYTAKGGHVPSPTQTSIAAATIPSTLDTAAGTHTQPSAESGPNRTGPFLGAAAVMLILIGGVSYVFARRAKNRGTG